MRFSLFLLFPLVLLQSCRSKQPPESSIMPSPNSSLYPVFQSLVDSMFHQIPNTKGIVMHVEAPDRQISWTGAAGWADSTIERKLLPTDPALIASMTKTYVAAAVLRLVEGSKIQLDQSIEGLLSESTLQLLKHNGYPIEHITVAHLCTHTSGIVDYVSLEAYQQATLADQGHEWTRDEQIALAMSKAPSLAVAEKFEYSETNYLLLTEIIERQTEKPFYTALRELLHYQSHELTETWFVSLEEAPKHLSPLIRQYATEFQVESYDLHPSFDLFGGGGIAATAKDAACFTQLLFTGQLFEKEATKELLYQTVTTANQKDNAYYMGIAKTELGPYTAYGHGGFWGTTTQYFPELNASITVFLLERDEWQQYRNLLLDVALLLDNNP